MHSCFSYSLVASIHVHRYRWMLLLSCSADELNSRVQSLRLREERFCVCFSRSLFANSLSIPFLSPIEGISERFTEHPRFASSFFTPIIFLLVASFSAWKSQSSRDHGSRQPSRRSCAAAPSAWRLSRRPSSDFGNLGRRVLVIWEIGIH